MSTTKPHHPPGPKSAPAHPAPAPAAQPPAYVPTKWSYPFAVGDGKDASDAHSFFEALSNAEDGFYPLGANGIWHGGIHFDGATGKILKQEDGVRAIADGEVVAYRLDSKYPVLKYQDGKSCMYSTGFVLVRHKLVLPPAPANASNSAGGAGAATAASHAGATSSAADASNAHATPAGPSPSTAAAPSADETLTFFSLYMHQLDWSTYKAALDAPSPTSDPSKTSNQPATSPIKCMPFWKGDKRYRVSSTAADTQREPSTFDFSFPDSMRIDVPDGGLGTPSVMSGFPGLSASSPNWLDSLAPSPDASAANPFRIDQSSSTAKPKAKQPLAKGAQVYSKAKGEAIGLLPQGCEVQLGAFSDKDKGWAPITKVMKGEPMGLVVGDPVDPRVPSGWVKVDQFDVLIDPQPLDSVVVLDKPYPVAAGTVVGYLGEYQRYREASKLPPSPQRPLMHVEVFAGPELPAFIKKSQVRAKQLPDRKAFLEVQKGALLVDVAEAKAAVKSGLLLKPLNKDGGTGPWVKVQPMQVAMPPTQLQSGHAHASPSHHSKVKPIETPEGTPVWVERAYAGRVAPPNVKAWAEFPLDVANARGPATGFDEVFSHSELDKLGADAKAQDGNHATWWKITVGTTDGDSREGWVCDTAHNLVESHSPWDWPGFELVDNTSVSVVDSFKRHLHDYDMLFDGDKEEFEPSAIRVNGSDLFAKLKRTANRLVSKVAGTAPVTDLENAIDRLGNNDGKVNAQELARAQRTRWVAQAMSHLVVRYESEWGGDLSKWESLSTLMKERKYIWQAELERIEKLRWWDKVHGVEGLPAEPTVYHFHPVGLVANFIKNPIDELIKKLGTIISSGEGGYESYNTGTHGPSGKVVHSFSDPPTGTITGKKINDILASGAKSPDDTTRYFATGKYQTTISTLREAVKKMGLSGEELYDPAMQERVFREFLIFHAGAGKLADFIFKGKGSLSEAQLAAAQEWASIAAPANATINDGRKSDGTMSFYEKAGQNHASMKSTEKVIEVLREIEGSR
jgi:hypothetical protein